MSDEIIFTADDEEPNCSRCDLLGCKQEFCDRCCGPEHWWDGYRKTTSWSELLKQLKQVFKKAK